MRIPLLILVLGLFNLAVADKSVGPAMKRVCDNIDKLVSSSYAVSLPSAKVRYAAQKWFKVNPCKTKLRFPFGGWTCIPGTDAVWIQAPVGIDITFKKVGTFSLVKNVFGNSMGDMISRSTAACKCLPEIFSVLDKDSLSALVTSTSVGEASSGFLQKFGKFSQCAIDAGFKVQDDKAGLTSGTGALVPANNFVFTAAEIDLSRYMSFATALAPCFVGGCSPDLIGGWFTRYLTDSEGAMAGQIKKVIQPWSDKCQSLDGQFKVFGSAVKNVGTKASELQGEIDNIIKGVCPDIDKCASDAVKDFKKQVDATLGLSKQVNEFNALITDTITDATQLADLLGDAVKAFDTLGDLGIDTIFNKVVSGEFRSIEDVAGALKGAQRLPSVINDVQDKFPKLNKAFTQFQTKAKDFVDSVQAVLKDDWLANFDGDSETADKMKMAIFQVQEKIASFIPLAGEIWSAISFFEKTIGSINLNNLKVGEVKIGVASYRRWTVGNFDMPCLTTGTIKFSFLGFKASAGYPKFYRCNQGYSLPFPNHHIPYIKLQYPQGPDSPLARLQDGASAGETTSIRWNGALPTGGAGAAPSASSVPIAVPSVPSSSAEPSPVVPTPDVPAPSPIAPSLEVPSPEVPSPPASSPTPDPVDVPSDPAPEPSTPVRKRHAPPVVMEHHIWIRRDDVPPDLDIEYEIPVSMPTDVMSDAAAAESTAAAMVATTAVFIDTTVGGVATTTQLDTQVTQAPTATEVVPVAETTLAVSGEDEEFGPFASLAATTGGELLTDFASMGTVVATASLPTADPKDVGTATSGASADSTSTSAAWAPQALGISWAAVAAGMALVVIV